MKKYLLYGAICMLANLSFAQTDEAKLANFQSENDAKVSLNELTNTPEFIRFSKEQPLVTLGRNIKSKAINFVNNYEAILGVPKSQLKFQEIKTDNYGLKHVVFIQHKNNVPVYDGQLRLHFDANLNIQSINGNLLPIANLNTTPEIEANIAGNKAIELVNGQDLNGSGVPLFVVANELVIFRKGLVSNTYAGDFLTYRVEVRNDADVREFLFIDANSGKIVQQFTGIAHAMDRVVYQGNTNAGSEVWEEGDVLPGALDIWQRNEVITSGHVYKFFENAFGYLSYDGADAQMVTINNNPNVNCPNATWNGATANYCNGTATDDVIAHEWGHAYTGSTSKLIYAFQSGALNEGYSDIWGETIDLLNGYEDAGEDLSLRNNCNNSLRWQVGEDATAFGGAIRDMYFPTCDGDPGKVTDGQYRCGNGDNGGVHSNSGVPNHAYALLVDGGNYNGQNITGLGFTKAAHIFWRAQSQYLTATSDFSVFADALEAAGTDLLGINLEGLSTDAPAGLSGEIITAADLVELNEVILATELRINPDACGYAALLNQDANLCANATSSPLYIEDWENGMGAWTLTQLPEDPGSWEARDWVLENTLPRGRAGQGVFGADPINGDCQNSLQNGIIRLQSPVINFPNNASINDYQLAFNHNISTEEGWDGANIKYSLNGGAWTLLPGNAFTVNAYNGSITFRDGTNLNDNPLRGQAAFTGSDEGGNTGSWGTSVVNLSAINAGSNDALQLRFEVGTDSCNGTVGWYLDELYVYSCSNALSTDSFSFLNENMTVSPNPSNGIFNVSNTKNIELSGAQVYDINGRLIKTVDVSNKQTNHTVNLSDVASGIYFLKVNTASSHKTFKLIKN